MVAIPFPKLITGLLTAIALLILTTSPLRAQNPPPQLWYITFQDQSDLQTLVTHLDVWEVDHANNRLLALLTPQEADTLAQTHALLLATDQSPLQTEPSGAIAQDGGIPGYACYRTVDETYATLDQLETTYPTLVKNIDIGDSWDKLNTSIPPGDDLRVLVITNQATTGPKFRFFLMGAIHAREYTTAELALRFAESLLQAYGNDANATWLLDHGELHLLTLANPDGRRKAEGGLYWRKNTNNDNLCTNYGVDLNRNSSFQWNGCDGYNCSSSYSCSETFRGLAPASEPEVASLEAYLRSIFPDQRGDLLTDPARPETSGMMLSLHSYGKLVLFPWGWTNGHAPNGHGLATVARRLGYPLNYTVCQAGGIGCLYQTDGTTDDYSYGELGIASFTIELGTAFFQTCDYFESEIITAGLKSLYTAFHLAPRPYQLSLGPEVTNVTVQPQTIDPHLDSDTTHITLTATADATRLAPLSGFDINDLNEPIEATQSARYTINQLPWEANAVAIPIQAADGLFDASQETLATTIEMACLPSGRHTLYVQAQDISGDWGIINAAFVTVTNNSPFTATLSTPENSVRTDESITYTLTITNSSATTATYSVEIAESDTLPLDVTIAPAATITLAAGTAAELTLAIRPKNNTVGNLSVPTVLNIRQIDNPSHCRRLATNTHIQGWYYQYRLLQIKKATSSD